MDKKDEHDLSAGGGSDSSGTGLSVEELEGYAPPENSPYRQMDLFSLMSEQLGNITVAQVEKPIQLSFPGTISEEKVAKILCTGGGLENSRKRIFAKYEQGKTPEEMTVEELQAAILAKMAGNGPVDDQMKKTVYDNIWHDSLVNWLKSFR